MLYLLIYFFIRFFFFFLIMSTFIISESEWIPVTPKPVRNSKPEPKKLFIPAKEVFHSIQQPLVTPPLQSIEPAPQILSAIQAEVSVVQSISMIQPVQQQSIFPTASNDVCIFYVHVI
jgi:hypothetical protein